MVVNGLFTQILLIAIINFVAAYFQAATGFGSAIIAMSFMPLVLPMKYCSAVSAVTIVAIGIQMVILLRKHIDFKLVLLPILFCLLTINLGLFFLMNFEERLLRLILAGLILLLSMFFIYSQQRKILIRKSIAKSALVGSITGISTGMFNIVGPFFMVYYAGVNVDPLVYKASLEFSFLVAGSYSMGMHIVYKNINSDTVPYILVSVVASLIAGWLGLKVFRKIDRDKLHTLIYIFLPVLALILILKT